MNNMNTSEESVRSVAREGVTISDLKWTTYIPIGASLALLAWLYMPIFQWWYRMWMADESYYSHGILVPFISAFVVWLKRKQLKGIPVQAYAPAYLVIIPNLLIVVFMFWAGALSVQGLVFPLLLGGLVLVILGRSMARELAFPIGYLYFMCALPGFILTILSFRIQMLSTMGGTVLLRALTFDAYREGATITLPNIEVLVGAPCSGFRLLIALFALSVLFVYLKEGPWWGKAILIGLTLPLSLVLNSIRIAMIAIVGEFMGSDAMHAFHDYSGYLMLVLAFIALFWLARLVKCEKFNSMLVSSQ